MTISIDDSAYQVDDGPLVDGSIRECRDGSVVVFDEPRLQLSRQQIAIVATIHARGRCLTSDLHCAVWGHDRTNGHRKPLTSAQRASMEQGVVERDGRRLELTEYGADLARDLGEKLTPVEISEGC